MNAAGDRTRGDNEMVKRNEIEKGRKENSAVKERIINVAWDLFSEKGFEATTLNDILEAAGIAKGTFYYYFRGKDSLLTTLSVVLDNYYAELDKELRDEDNAYDKLMYLNYKVHTMIGEKIDPNLMANLYSAQLLHEDKGYLLDRNRYYFRLITKIIDEGQKRGEIIRNKSVDEIVRIYSLCERALITDWCMNNGDYDLGAFSKEYMPMFFAQFKA